MNPPRVFEGILRKKFGNLYILLAVRTIFLSFVGHYLYTLKSRRCITCYGYDSRRGEARREKRRWNPGIDKTRSLQRENLNLYRLSEYNCVFG